VDAVADADADDGRRGYGNSSPYFQYGELKACTLSGALLMLLQYVPCHSDLRSVRLRVRFMVNIIPGDDALLPGCHRVADGEHQLAVKCHLEHGQDLSPLLVVWQEP